MKRKVSVWPRIRAKYPQRFGVGVDVPGKASDWIRHAEGLPSGTKVVVYCRVSSTPQQSAGNLKEQLSEVLAIAKGLGLVVVATYMEACSGWVRNREALEFTAARAKVEGAKLLADSVDRYIRNEHFNSETNWEVQPTVAEFRCLAEETLGLELHSCLSPDATPREVRSHQTRRGQKAKGKRGGRPLSRKGKLERAKQLSAEGQTNAEIARLLGVHRSTVGRWL